MKKLAINVIRTALWAVQCSVLFRLGYDFSAWQFWTLMGVPFAIVVVTVIEIITKSEF